jgi:hypothetical protein
MVLASPTLGHPCHGQPVSLVPSRPDICRLRSLHDIRLPRRRRRPASESIVDTLTESLLTRPHERDFIS